MPQSQANWVIYVNPHQPCRSNYTRSNPPYEKSGYLAPNVLNNFCSLPNKSLSKLEDSYWTKPYKKLVIPIMDLFSYVPYFAPSLHRSEAPIFLFLFKNTDWKIVSTCFSMTFNHLQASKIYGLWVLGVQRVGIIDFQVRKTVMPKTNLWGHPECSSFARLDVIHLRCL